MPTNAKFGKQNFNQNKTSRKKTVMIALFLAITILSGLALVSVKLIANNTTSPTSVQADSNFQPNTNASFSDTFSDGKVNDDRWNDYKSFDKIQITETAADNLNILVPEGSSSGKARFGGVTLKEQIPTGDFRATISLRKPSLKSSGAGIAGVSFSSSGTDDDESVRVYWRVDGTKSELVMTAKDSTGKLIESNKIPVEAAKVNLSLVRVDKKYVAQYSIGTDDDRNFIKIGEVEDPKVGAAGKIRIFANNLGADGKFPKLVSRVDRVSLAWFDASKADKEVFSDTFTSGQINQEHWQVDTTDGTSVSQNQNDNLVMRISAGNQNNKVKAVSLVSKTVVDDNKNMNVMTQMFKPVVTGEGTGRSGIQFLTKAQDNEGSSSIFWEVTGASSKLIFIVQGKQGKTLAREEVELANDINKVALRIARNKDGYIAMYKTNLKNDEGDWKRFSNRVITKATDKGNFRIFTSNVGRDKKYPEVRGRFDVFRVSYVE